MNRNKVIAVILCLLLAVGSGLGGFVFGQRSGRAQADENALSAGADGVDVQDTIAVVNLDSGVLVNGEQTYYGEQIIEFPDENFVFTSLEDARNGIENGRYTAYIIVPSDFSESVESLNTVPSAAQIQYAVSGHVSGDRQSEILQQVLQFGEQLNSQISYMYVCNIMNEFHGAQDEAAMVMRNDAADKEAIDRIQPYDLISMIAVPELKQQEDTTKAMDVSGYVEENVRLIADIDNEYRSNLASAGAQLNQLRESGRLLVDTLQELSDGIGSVDLLMDQNGQYLCQPGIESLRSTLTNYNTARRDSNDKQAGLLVQAETKRQELAVFLQQCIDSYNQQTDVWTQEMLGNYRDAVREQIPQLKLEEVEDTNLGQYRLTCEEVPGKGTPPSVVIGIEQESSSDGIQNREYLNKIIGMILTAERQTPDEGEIPGGEESSGGEESNPGNEGETPGGDEQNPGGEGEDPGGEPEDPDEGGEDPGDEPMPVTVQEALQQCDEDTMIAEFLAEHHYANTEAFLQDYLEGNVNVEPETFQITVIGDIGALEQYIADSINDIDTSSYQLPYFQGNWTDQTGQAITFQDMMTDIGVLFEFIRENMALEEDVAVQNIEELVLGECISPLEDRTEEVKQQIADMHEEEVDVIAQYHDSMNQYRPKQETAVMNENAGQMRANAIAMQQEILQSNQSYMNYADSVYDGAQQNIMALQEHIQEAKEASQQAVSEGLEEVKEIKRTTSSENQSAMADFAVKLPYTRIGSMESTQVYEFIASPVQLMPVSDYQRLKDEVDYTVAGSQAAGTQADTKRSGTIAEIICYAVFGIMVIGLSVRMVRNRQKRRQEQPAG